jgi:dTDP-L-rhamnose 4-epimerase
MNLPTRLRTEAALSENVLITGGAGFIGSHVSRRLLERGHRVVALDNLTPQVHEDGARPAYLPAEVDLIVGDVRDREAVDRALEGIDAVVHLAARVGVGQSMYEIAEYASVNTLATGILLEAMMDRPVRKLLVASSMSVYGEGLYRDVSGQITEATPRDRTQLERGDWDPLGADGQPLEPLPTSEAKPPSLSSIYALGKFDQERMCLLYGSAYQVPTVALRFFNVYGRDQALSNPYTGVLAIFANRLLNDLPPLIYEDGGQRRDFVSVGDVAEACALALEHSEADGQVLNIAGGHSFSVLEIAEKLAHVLGRDHLTPTITSKYRVGDIRHCFADIQQARSLIGFEPRTGLEVGMIELAEWLERQAVGEDRFESAGRELAARGLTL